MYEQIFSLKHNILIQYVSGEGGGMKESQVLGKEKFNVFVAGLEGVTF
jgi:hypothetical protein